MLSFKEKVSYLSWPALESADVQHSSLVEELECWMTNLEGNPIENVPILNLFIPGSHDSGAYQLTTKYGFSVDRLDLIKSWFLNALSFITYPLIQRYSITQRHTVAQQLKYGIRYVDLRVALRPNDNQFYICHNFYGPKFNEILEQIKQFVDQHPKEVLILDFQHLHGFSLIEHHHRLFEMLLYCFRSKLVTNDQPLESVSLKSLRDRGQQVFIFYRNKNFQSICRQFLWPGDQLPNPWPNTRDPVQLKQFIRSSIDRRPDNKLFVTQGVLTPNTNYVLCHMFGTLESQLCCYANRTIQRVIVDQFSNLLDSADSDQPQCDQQMAPIGPNIVLFDFIEWNCYRLPIQIVALNRRFGKK